MQQAEKSKRNKLTETVLIKLLTKQERTNEIKERKGRKTDRRPSRAEEKEKNISLKNWSLENLSNAYDIYSVREILKSIVKETRTKRIKQQQNLILVWNCVYMKTVVIINTYSSSLYHHHHRHQNWHCIEYQETSYVSGLNTNIHWNRHRQTYKAKQSKVITRKACK